ncbi:MAG TPA: Gfo/Idh/MocA family oxidoreductase [Candidatus Hydrogenedentes bacterium]|nr:Gfo/Idh/MocA family oxidoreductase [Candidatus Hydrogenedentota bacterium]
MKKRTSRREFIERAAGIGTIGILAGCATTTAETKQPVSAVKRRIVGANDRIQLGFIGIGSRAGSMLESTLAMDGVDVVAVCDTYDANLNRASEWCKKKVPGVRSYIAFEDMLEKEHMDAIVTGTPDHIHFPVILAALDAGLDVYTEKPMTLTWESAKIIRDRVRETGAVVQVGTQLRSMEMYHKARAVAQSGELGKLMSVHVHRDGGGSLLDKSKTPVNATESTTHWPLFLRDTKKYAYDPLRYFHWRQFREYSNGYFGDLMMHHMDMCHFITGCGMPSRVKAVGGIYLLHDGRTCPDTVSAILEYPEEFHFTYTTTAANAHYGLVERYLFEKGVFEIRGMGEMSIFRDKKEEKVPSKGILNEPHLQNFFDCIRTRQKPIAPVEAGLMAAACAHMAVLSMDQGETATWDAARECVEL